jgi:hypothetical protein
MSIHLGMPHEAVIEQMTRFANMLRDEILEAAEHTIQCAMEFEREACANVCEGHYDTAQAARAIRARGQRMKVNEYQVMRDCIQAGINRGWQRAHKHTETPSPEQVLEAIEDAIMLQLAEYFIYEGEE